MNKILVWLGVAISVVSCSKSVDIEGSIKNANPLERLEVIEMASANTLPIVNAPIDKNGHFKMEFEIPKNGLYLLTYGGNTATYYLKQGDAVSMSGDAESFPMNAKFGEDGKTKANNDFINKIDEYFREYKNKINIEHLVGKDEKNFLVEFNKIKKDLDNTSNRLSKQLNPDKEVINYIDTKHKVLLLSLLDIYEMGHKMVTNQPNFKVSKHFNDLKNEILKDRDKMVAEFPEFRQFELRLLNNDFQKFAQPKLLKQGNDKIVISELFLEFLKTRKDISPLERDYLLSYTLSEYDLRPNNMKNYDKIHKIIDGLTTSKVKDELKQLQIARMGEKAGNSLNLNVLKGNKNFNFNEVAKGKPTLVIFYASYTPNISITMIPILKEINNAFKSKLNFAFINVDDTKQQFEKTSKSLLNGISGEHYYLDGGINSREAYKIGLYSFNLPTILILDKNGKLYGRKFFKIEDPELLIELQRLTGIIKQNSDFAPQASDFQIKELEPTK